jgi:hypothetical protein
MGMTQTNWYRVFYPNPQNGGAVTSMEVSAGNADAAERFFIEQTKIIPSKVEFSRATIVKDED